MASITRCWPIVLSLALAACGGDPQGSTLRSARIEDGALRLELDLRFTDTLLQALDHGIPLQLALHVDGASASVQRIELRYRPLSRQYELRLPGEADARVFASRARLLAALDRVVLSEVSAASGRVRVELVSSALPAPLRLPALIEREWQLATPQRSWSR